MTTGRRFLLVGLALVAVLFVGVMSTIIVSLAIWPGEAKLTAPILCSDARPDPFVVRDSYSYRPGEETVTFTLYCVGPRGDYDEIGVFAPFLVLAGFHTAAVGVVAFAVFLRFWLRSRRRGRDAGLPGQEPATASTIR